MKRRNKRRLAKCGQLSLIRDERRNSAQPEFLRNAGQSAGRHLRIPWPRETFEAGRPGSTIAASPSLRKGMPMHKRLVTLAIAGLLMPAAALAQKVSYDYEKSANFATFKTYAQKDGTKVGQSLID